MALGVLLLFVISYVFAREERDTNDFFLGRRRVPVIVACLSFVAGEISALTIVGFPATAYSENWEYVQFFIGSAAARIFVAFVFIHVFYQQHPLVPRPEEAKEVLSYFVAYSLPAGLKGLLLAAIILASIDSPLSSLCSSFVTDIYRPLIKQDASERHYLWVSRLGIAGFGLVLALIAWACGPVKNVLWFAFQVFSLTGGAVLGVFLLGLLTQRKANRGNVLAMVLSTALTTTLMILSKREIIPLVWSWLIVVGTATTMGVGYLLGCPAEKSEVNEARTQKPESWD